MYSKQFEAEFENNKQVYLELAERRTIEILGLNEKQALYAKAFETTKVVELNKLKNEMFEVQNQKMTWRKILFSGFD